jgi:hypothetical protein
MRKQRRFKYIIKNIITAVTYVLQADPYTQVIDLLQTTCPVVFYNPSKSFAIQVLRLTCDL